MSSTPILRRPDIAVSILIVGGILYGVLCGPATERRGYPPIDPIWLGVTYLWVAPVCLSALFDSFCFRSRLYQLAIYAIVTAFFDSGTMPMATPRFVTLTGMLMSTLFPLGPLHLVGVFGAEALMQLLLRPARRLVDDAQQPQLPPQNTLVIWITGFFVLSIAVGFPLAYRSVSIAAERARAIALADRQWASGDALIFQDMEFRNKDRFLRDGVQLEYDIDPATGLRSRNRMADLGFRDAYNTRIAELIERYGLPEWSLKQYVPSADDLIALLTAKDFVEITSFPHELNSSIVLMRRGRLSRWGSTFVSGNKSLSIVTERSGLFGVGDGVQPVYVRITGPLIVIRNGTNWIGLFYKDGRRIASAFRL